MKKSSLLVAMLLGMSIVPCVYSSPSINPSFNNEAEVKVDSVSPSIRYLDPRKDDDYSIILKHIQHLKTDKDDVQNIHRILEVSRNAANSVLLMNVEDTSQELDAHHSIHNPKTLVNEVTMEQGIFNSVTANFLPDMSYAFLDIGVWDSAGNLIGSVESKLSYSTAANRMHLLSKVDTDYIEQNYNDGEILEIESFLVSSLANGVNRYQLMTKKIPASELMITTEKLIEQVTVSSPEISEYNKSYGREHATVCLNRDHLDCDISLVGLDFESNSDFKLHVPLSGEIKIARYVTEIAASDDAADIGDGTTGAWVMIGNDRSDGIWGALNNKSAKVFSDYVVPKHYLTDQGTVGTVLSWDIPLTEAAFGSGYDEWKNSLYRREENMQWEVQFKVKTQIAVDSDGNLETTDDLLIQTGSELATTLVVDNATVKYEGWLYPDQLPYLRIDY